MHYDGHSKFSKTPLLTWSQSQKRIGNWTTRSISHRSNEWVEHMFSVRDQESNLLAEFELLYLSPGWARISRITMPKSRISDAKDCCLTPVARSSESGQPWFFLQPRGNASNSHEWLFVHKDRLVQVKFHDFCQIIRHKRGSFVNIIVATWTAS